MNKFDSNEERLFDLYLQDLKKYGFIEKYEYNNITWILSQEVKIQEEKQLKTKTKIVQKSLIKPHIYTPDFTIYWNYSSSIFHYPPTFKKEGELKYFYTNEGNVSIIEIKPSFDRYNMTRLFTINQKWVYDKYGIYVQKIVPQELFQKTFYPSGMKLKKKVMYIEDFIKLKNLKNEIRSIKK